MFLRLAFTIFLALVAASRADTQQGPILAPTYPNTENGLKRLIQDLREAALRNDSQRFATLAQSLTLPKPAAWFVETFGDYNGPGTARVYESTLPRVADLLEASFVELERQGFTEAQVVQLASPCDPGVTDHEYPVLLARIRPVPMYAAHFKKKKQIQSLGFFVHVEGAFRYVGHVVFFPPPDNQESKEPPRRIKIGGNVQAASLTYKPNPTYPVQARQNFIQGTVRLEAVIGRDGSVRGLKVVSGHCWLAEASVEAVRQWRYKPTLLEGQPVEVSTTIDVVFTLMR